MLFLPVCPIIYDEYDITPEAITAAVVISERNGKEFYLMDEYIVRMITLELKPAFPNYEISQMLEVYEGFASLNTPVEKGIRSDWMDNISSFYQMTDAMRACHKSLLNSESFFKKLLYLVNEEKYNSILSDPKLGLYRTLEEVGLMRLLPPGTNISTVNETLFEDPLQRAVIRTYQLRNNSSHTSDDWSVSSMLENVNAIMISTMYAVWQNRKMIQGAVSKEEGERVYGVDTALRSIVKEYNKRISSGFRFVPLLWESAERGAAGKKPKHINIKELISEKHIMLLGDAGCGKTTSLDYLEYQDANTYLDGDSPCIPVKLTLIGEDAGCLLEDMICRKINIPMSFCEMLLKKNLLHLYIDGLNELSMNISTKKDFIISLENFMARYPNTFIVVTDRRYSPVQLKIETKYLLRKMEKDDILKYAASRPECNKTIIENLSDILDMPGFSELDFTPLLLNQLVTALHSGAGIPADPTELIGVYLEALLDREYNEKRNLDAAPGKLDLLLMKLALEEIPEEGLPLLRVMRIFADTMREYGIKIESDACINVAVQLGILKQTGNMIDFVLEEYKTYFLLRAVEANL